MGYESSEMAAGIQHPDRARPAKLVREHLAAPSSRCRYGPRRPRQGRAIAVQPDRAPDLVIVGQQVRECLHAADAAKQILAQRDGRAEAGRREPERCSDEDVRYELIVMPIATRRDQIFGNAAPL